MPAWVLGAYGYKEEYLAFALKDYEFKWPSKYLGQWFSMEEEVGKRECGNIWRHFD